MRLALGTAQFGLSYGVANLNGQISQDSAKEIVEYCTSVGIDTLDTAIGYGESEQCLGKVGVAGFDVVTKLPSISEPCADIDAWVMREVSASIIRLNVKSLYGLMLHRPEQLLGRHGEEILKSLQKLKDLGVVEKIGISVYSPEEIEKFFSLHVFDIVQVPFNLVDRRLVTSGWLDKLSIGGVEVHTRSSFLQGLLLMPRDAIPNKFKAWDFLWDHWHDWLKKNAISPVEGCLAYVLSHSAIDRVVIGVDTLEQLEQIVISTSQLSKVTSFPDISSTNIDLINPTNWNIL